MDSKPRSQRRCDPVCALAIIHFVSLLSYVNDGIHVSLTLDSYFCQINRL